MNTERSESFLTIDELVSLDILLKERGIDLDIALEAPVKLDKKPAVVDAGVDSGTLGRWSYKPGMLLILEQQGKCRLSDETRQMEEEWLAKTLHKANALRNRKRYTRKRGTVHPKKKEATRRRNRMKLWARQPLTCVLYRDRRKCKSIDKRIWDEHIEPYWMKYDPEDLSIDFPWWAGTKAKPWSLWNMTLTHKKDGVLWNGSDMELYYLSGGFGAAASLNTCSAQVNHLSV